MNRLLSILILASISLCSLPTLNSPASNTLLTYLLKSLLKPAIEITIIYKGVSYKPGDTIELGSSNAFSLTTYPIILKVTGTEPISINSKNAFTLETTSNGSLDVTTSNPPPTIWPVNYEQPLDIVAMPDGNPKNEWKFKLQITSPSTTELIYFVKINTNVKQSKVLVVSGSAFDQSFVSSFAFDSSAGTISAENQLEFGAVNVVHNIESSYDNRYIFFNNLSNTNFRSFQVGSNNSVTEVAGSPFSVIGNVTNIVKVPNKNMLVVAEVSNLHTIPYNSSTGALGTLSGAFGTICSAPQVTFDSKGDYIFASTTILPQFIGQVQSSKINSDGSLTSNAVKTDPDITNLLGLHLRSKINKYLFTATHTPTPGANNLKVSNILRRFIDENGNINNVDTYFTLSNNGQTHSNFIAHPSDKYFYLIGSTNTPGNFGIIQILNHDPKTGTVSFNSRVDIAGSQTVTGLKISPDGKYAAALVSVNNSVCIELTPGSCTFQVILYRINSDGSFSQTQVYTRTSKLEFFSWAEF